MSYLKLDEDREFIVEESNVCWNFSLYLRFY